MINKEHIKEVLKIALSTGGDFAEIYAEDAISNSFNLVNGKVENAVGGRSYGVGIRIFKGFRSIYSYCNSSELGALKDTAHKAAAALNDSPLEIDINLVERINKNISPIIYVPSNILNEKKITILKDAYKVAKEYSDEIAQVSVGYGDTDKKILIANSEGLYTEDRRIRTRVFVNSIASNGTENQTGFEGPGRSMGYEFFENVDMEAHAREASRCAITMLHAKECPKGKMSVAIDNGFGGVIFHEACGHSLEATSVAKGNSTFCNMLGKQIASTKVTAIDDGTIPNSWGTINIDDEGMPTRRNVLIENGILKSYMIDKLNGRRMGMEPTGNARRQSYKFAPTSRMTNTFIAPGTDKREDIIKSMEYGLYAKKMGGGSVNPVTGEFNFNVAEGYLVKNGKIADAVRGASLIGKGSEVLMNIDMVSDNLAHGQGMCGSSSGSIPVNVGQPLIRVKEITVGGR